MSHNRKISVTGLGYVGLPVAMAFARHARVIGFDVNSERISQLQNGTDNTNEVSSGELQNADIIFTDDAEALKGADFHIIAVPTPVNDARQPDLRALLLASELVGSHLKKGDVIVYESTVYPGATEEDCVPVLEGASGLKAGVDFFAGYSPERINPGDKEHTFARLNKIVSGQPAVLDIVAAVYESVVDAGVHRAPSIKVAEAAKVIENTQRDINIALMNELALICNKLEIDTGDVLAAAGTKWNFLPFTPGLVGGHCVSIDPYYLAYKATKSGYSPNLILAGRTINDSIGQHIASSLVKSLIRQGARVKDSVITVLGLAFKENIPDIRNTGVIGIVDELAQYHALVQVYDPLADKKEVHAEYGIDLTALEDLALANAVILAVPHKQFIDEGWALIEKLLNHPGGVVYDVKGILPQDKTPDGICLHRL